MSKEFKRDTILFGTFGIVTGIVYILIGVFVYPRMEDQEVFVVMGIVLILFAIWYLYDQLI